MSLPRTEHKTMKYLTFEVDRFTLAPFHLNPSDAAEKLGNRSRWTKFLL